MSAARLAFFLPRRKSTIIDIERVFERWFFLATLLLLKSTKKKKDQQAEDLPRQDSVCLSSITSHLLFLEGREKETKEKIDDLFVHRLQAPESCGHPSVHAGFSTVHCPSSPRQSEIGLPTTMSACRSIDRGTNSFHSGLGMTTTGMDRDWTSNLGSSVGILKTF